MTEIIIIAALDENHVIGNKKTLPWHVPEDFKHFQETTNGHAVIMGRTTFESLGKPLSNRLNIVLTRNPESQISQLHQEGVIVLQSLSEAIQLAKQKGYQRIFLIGGASLYLEGFAVADKMILSHIPGVHEGDTFFPPWNSNEWRVTNEQQREGFAIKTYERKRHEQPTAPSAISSSFFSLPLQQADPALYQSISDERYRQQTTLNLIPSENYVSRAVLEATGSVLNNKYSEGYPGKRYYQGNECIDTVEQLAIDRAKKLFNVNHVNVQPYSGSPANQAVYYALLQPGDKIMGMHLFYGGHLTHGWKVNFSGKFYTNVGYTTEQNGFLDYDKVEELAEKERPKIIVCGGTGYPRLYDFKRLGQIAKNVGAYFLADIAHEAGLIAATTVPSPAGHADVITTTTHKTLRGPRGAMIMCNGEPSTPMKELPAGADPRKHIPTLIDRAVFPGLQGGPHNHTTAGIAAALHEAMQPSFKPYCEQIIANAKALAATLMDHGVSLVSGGTDKHLLLADLTNKGIGLGKEAAVALERAGLIVNANTIPYDPSTPFKPSGIRLGTPAMTTRGLKEEEMKQVGEWIASILNVMDDRLLQESIKTKVQDLCAAFPVYHVQ